MAASIVDADTLIAIDVGTVTTRAFLFDAVAGSYRFIATGSAASTCGPPMNDATEGVRSAIDDLQSTTGRTIIDAEENLISPATAEGLGVDSVVATVSAVPPLKVLAVGLLEDVSLESAQSLAARMYARVVDSVSMNDRRRLAAKIDLVLRHRPDVVIVTGGSENGASKSVLKLIDPVGLACYLMPESQRPAVLFAGNSGVAEEVQSALSSLAPVTIAPNVRPTLEAEQLGPAEGELRSLFRRIYAARNPGLQELNAWTSGRLLPSATGFGRMIRFISRNETRKAVLGLDVGASATVVASAHDGDLRQRIYSRLGTGTSFEGVFRHASLGDIARWLPFEFSETEVRDFALHRMAHPSSIPMTEQEAALELAFVREVLRAALQDAAGHFPAAAEARRGRLPSFEPIIVSGSALTGAPNPGYAMLALLDGIQPSGVTVVLQDVNQVLPALGAAAEINAVLPVQVLESGILKSLGTVISPVGESREGASILRVRALMPSGEERKLDIKQGSLTVLPLDPGQKADLQLQPLQRFDVGLGGPGRGGTIKAVGGRFGVVIDARGRPLQLPTDAAQRREALRTWMAVFDA